MKTKIRRLFLTLLAQTPDGKLKWLLARLQELERGVSMKRLLVAVVLLAGTCYGQERTSCYMWLGSWHCYSTGQSQIIPMPQMGAGSWLGGNQIQIPDFVGHNIARREQFRRERETRAWVDLMRKQSEPPLVLGPPPPADPVETPAPAAPAQAEKRIDLIEIIDYAKGLFQREKAGEISKGTVRELLNIKISEWERDLIRRGVELQARENLIKLGVNDVKALANSLGTPIAPKGE